MIVTVHALGSIATATVLSRPSDESATIPFRLVVGFLIGIIIHGVLDVLPHNYPLAAPVDVLFASGLIGLALIFVQKRNRMLLLVCFLGALFPDIFDHGPLIAARRFGIALPHLPIKIFPWHWKEYSGSIYDGSNRLGSWTGQIAFVILSCLALFVRRKPFFRLGGTTSTGP